MAIVQISKIIHRTGANIDLPQLDTGEIGFASDTKQVYIGNDPIIHPPGSPEETTQTEILTDASTIGFNQIAGSATTTLDISGNVENGQVLVANNSTWVNRGGTVGGLINLGNVANVKLSGGVNGYVLQTDGHGNLSWAVNGVIKYEIANINYLVGDSQGAVIITTSTPHLLPTGATVTIMGVTGSTIQAAINDSGITLDTGGGVYVSSNRFYIKRLTDTTFSLYTDPNAITQPVIGTGWNDSTPYVSGTGYALGFVSPSGTVTPGGTNTQIQFNDSSAFGGTNNLTFNKTTGLLNINGNLTATTVTANIRGNFDGRVGYFTPNTGAFTSITASTTMTATGNITGGNIKTTGTANVGTLIVTGNSTMANASIANVKSDHILYANGTPWPIGVGYTTIGGSNTQIQFNNQGQFYGSANLVFDITSNTLTATKIVGNGVGLTNITGANVTGQVGYAAVANSVSWGNITSKPSFATVSTSGSYDDLNNKPTIPTAQIQSDWTETNNTLKSYIVNKPVTGVMPQVLLYNQNNINRTLELTDAGKHVYIKSDSGTYSANVVVPTNSSVAFSIGTKIDIINSPYSATDTNIKIADNTTTSVFLANYENPAVIDNPIVIQPGEIAHLLKVETDTWIVERKR